MTRSTTRAGRKRPSTLTWLVPFIIGIAAIALIVVSFVMNRDDTDAAPAPSDSAATPAPTEVQQPETDLSDLEARDPADSFAVGQVDADVVMIVFSDFQCPYCAGWHHDTLPAMMEYVDDGKLRIEFRDIAIFGDESKNAVRASYAAAQQDALLDYQGALFEGGETRSESDLSVEALVQLAGELGLDEAQFAADLDSEEASATLEGHSDFAASLGVNSTPAFIVGGQPLLGAQPTEVFVDAVEQALGGA